MSLFPIIGDVKFIVNGGKELSGEIEVRGSKNAATPILVATLLTSRPCVIKNIPLIGDVLTIIEILKAMGSKIEWLEKRTIRITNNEISPKKLDPVLIRKIRSSILLIGPLLARFGEIKINTPGGCYIGVRPMDAHFDAFQSIGFDVDYDDKKDIHNIKKSKKNLLNEVVLKEFSVTATENIMMFAALNPGVKIKLAALEPHIQDLGKFLEALGAEIDGIGQHEMLFKNSVEKKGGEVSYEIMNDPIEAGTFMALGAATKSNIRILGTPVESLTLPLLKLKEFGVNFKVDKNVVEIRGRRSKLKAVSKLMTQPYPGFPSDLQAPFGVLATQAEGETLIFDTLYEGRLKYLYELDKMGARAEILDSHRAVIKGPKQLVGKNVESIDLRAGATLVIAALVAVGESTLHTAEQVDRGYERIEKRLRLLGADIQRVK